MAKGFGGMPQGMNMNALMKQAQKMQKEMEKSQEQLAEMEFTATSGGGAVEVLITGKKVVKSIKLKPEVVDADDIEMLEDLVLTAVNEAIRQSEEYANAQMARLTGGAGLPGGMF